MTTDMIETGQRHAGKDGTVIPLRRVLARPRPLVGSIPPPPGETTSREIPEGSSANRAQPSAGANGIRPEAGADGRKARAVRKAALPESDDLEHLIHRKKLLGET